jgi:hypothetical protein
LTLHALYHASLTHIALAEDDEFGSKEWEEGLSALRDMLGFVAGRWGLAGELCDIVLVLLYLDDECRIQLTKMFA